MIVLSVLLIIFGFSLMLTGAGFIKADIWKSGSKIEGHERIVLGLLIAYVMITWLFSGFGICIAKKRTCKVPCIAAYGILLFCAIMLPLFTYGVGFNKLGRIDDDDIYEMCDRPTYRTGNRMV
jgi:hypothetical protein